MDRLTVVVWNNVDRKPAARLGHLPPGVFDLLSLCVKILRRRGSGDHPGRMNFCAASKISR
jgi:hypothetical protein